MTTPLPPIHPDLLKPENLPAIEREAIKRRGFYEFVKLAWHVARPGETFVGGWHLEMICRHLEAVSAGKCRRLIINVPPGMSKSSLVSIFWPAWDWIAHRSRKFIAVTFDDTLAGRDSLACRDLIESEWFQQRWGDVVRVEEERVQYTQGVWGLKAGGRRFSTTVAGRMTGWHADILIVDDPIKPADIKADPEIARNALDRCWEWWSGTVASRMLPRSAQVIIMQRLHEMDLVGKILELDATTFATTGKREWTHCMLPMRFETDRACTTPYGADPRREDGALLCPERFDAADVAAKERTMGAQVSAAQHQQRPAPAGGNVFKRSWFDVRWLRPDNPKWATIPLGERERYVPLPRLFSGEISVDCALKDSAGADNTALIVGAESGAKHYLMDCIADRMDLNSIERCIAALAARHPYARAKLIEDKANGPAVEQRLRSKMSGIIMITPEGGKVARANAVSPLCEAGDVILPDDSECDWVGDFIEELVTFPFARRDDRVDAFTQWLVYASARSNSSYLAMIEAVQAGRVRFAMEDG